MDDNQRGVDRWNKIIRDAQIDFEITLPSRRFNRTMGVHRDHCFDTAGEPISETEFKSQRDEWLPSVEDKAYVKRLMKPVLGPGQMANWIAAPARGIHGQPIEFEYVRRV